MYHLAVGGLCSTKRTDVYHSLFTHHPGASCCTESTAGTVSCTSDLEWLKNIPFPNMAWFFTSLYTRNMTRFVGPVLLFFALPYCHNAILLRFLMVSSFQTRGARAESTAGRMDWMSFGHWWIQDVNKAYSSTTAQGGGGSFKIGNL